MNVGDEGPEEREPMTTPMTTPPMTTPPTHRPVRDPSMRTPPASRTPSSPSELRRVAFALAMLGFALAAPAAYVAQRIFERARSGPSDPLLIVFDLHTSFYWRASTAAWWGVVAAIAVYAFTVQPRARVLRERLPRVIALCAVPFAIAVALATWRMP